MRQQRGVSTLVSVLALFLVMALVAVYADRHLVIEQRIAQRYQALGSLTEAGQQATQRLLGLLNSDKLDLDCQADPQGPDTLRQRLLRFDADGHLATAPELSPYPVICDRKLPEAWQCQCPANRQPTPLADDGLPRESALIRLKAFSGEPALGRIGVEVLACAGSSLTCLQAASDELERQPRVQLLQLLGALKMPPHSALIARGDVDLGTGMAVLHNDAASGGIALRAGGAVLGQLAGVHGPAGSPPGLAIVGHDAQLQALDEPGFFRRFFGMAPEDYGLHPVLRRLRCLADCGAALAVLVDGGAQLIWRDGDLQLWGGHVLGSESQPLLLIVRGRLGIDGGLHLRGLVYASEGLIWRNPGGEASVVQGAVLVGGPVEAGHGATALFDAAVIERLHLQAGSFIPLPGGAWSGSW